MTAAAVCALTIFRNQASGQISTLPDSTASIKTVTFRLLSARRLLPIQGFTVQIRCSELFSANSDDNGSVTFSLPAHQSCLLESQLPDLPITAQPKLRVYSPTVEIDMGNNPPETRVTYTLNSPHDPIPISTDSLDGELFYIDIDTPIPRDHSFHDLYGLSNKPPGPPPNYPSDGTNSLIKVFYATDRQPITSATNGVEYGPKENPDNTLHYGTCLVSIPRDHRMGELETPNMFAVEFRYHLEHYVLLRKVTNDQPDKFRAELNDTIDRSPSKDVVVFIHGFNVSFEEAARRTAQVAYDLGFKGAPVVYSWPSRSSLDDYAADEESVEWTTQHLREFLEMLASKTHTERIHVIAHSMGNRALLSALSLLTSTYPNIQEIALAAPDISAPRFKQLVPLVQSRAKRITLYASSKDQALILSEQLHHFPRAGEAGDQITIIPPVETIDASAVQTDFIGHSYIMDRPSLLSDLFYLLLDQPASQRFGLEEKSYNGATYWSFRQ